MIRPDATRAGFERGFRRACRSSLVAPGWHTAWPLGVGCSSANWYWLPKSGADMTSVAKPDISSVFYGSSTGIFNFWHLNAPTRVYTYMASYGPVSAHE